MPKFRQTPKKQPESSITALQFKEIAMALSVQPLKCEGWSTRQSSGLVVWTVTY
jgi:hypothetical protein